MDWQSLTLTLQLATVTLALLLPLSLPAAYWLATTQHGIKPWVEGLFALPLVLPPTVIGFYLLIAMGRQSWFGQAYEDLFGQPLVFSFSGLVLASIIFNIPFAVQPIQRAFEGIPVEVREAGQCCGLTFRQRFLSIELPLAWPGMLSAAVFTFAHTLGEFGVVLMVGGSIPGETKTVAIAIYDRTQAFDLAGANAMSLLLLSISLATIVITYGLIGRMMRGRRIT